MVKVPTEKVHNAKHFEAKEPTCDVDGNMEYWYCEFCDKYYADKDLTQEISKENTIIKALGHNYVDGKCTVCGMADPNYNQGQVTPSQPDNTEEQDNSSDNHKPEMIAIWYCQLLYCTLIRYWSCRSIYLFRKPETTADSFHH